MPRQKAPLRPMLLPSGRWHQAVQITGSSSSRKAATTRLIGGTISAPGAAEIGAPSRTKMFCMSIASSAVRWGSSSSCM